MSTVGYATLEVIPSMRGFGKALDKGTAAEMSRAGASGGKRFGDAAGAEAATGFKSRMSGALKGFAPFAGLAVGAGLVAGFKDVVGAASEAQQATGGVQAVFGKYADQVIADSEQAAQGLGLSATAYQELITLSGALLKNKGIADFADQGRQLVQVGADLAAQFGGSTQEAVDALNAAMRGESDPIERYAISLNETAIQAELAKTGLTGLDGAALDQAKTQARLSLIMQQSADAQGAFGREADTLAGRQARLTAALADMRVELGEKALPIVSGFVGFLGEKGVPALEAAGGAAVDMARGISDLPGPVKAAASAFVALRLASAAGLSSGLAAGVSHTGSAMESLRLRTMLASDAYRGARTVTRSFGDTTARVSSGVGRMSASLAGVKAAATGAGSALRTGLGGVMGLLGGPWGIALIGATALVGKFWAEHQEAKAHVEELGRTLDDQTGAITDNTRAAVVNALEKEGILKTARELGLSLDTVTDAATGETAAIDSLRQSQEMATAAARAKTDADGGMVGSSVRVAAAYAGVINAATGQTGAIEEARSAALRHRSAMGASGTATAALGTQLQTYGSKIAGVRSELEKLIDAEKERALAQIQQRRDQIALRETLAAAREELASGARTLNINTKAGRDNMSALLDLGEQWANSTNKVKDAKGAYVEMRTNFIDVARKMGATREEAVKLANKILDIPPNAPIRFQSEGYRERMAEIEALKRAARELGSASLDYTPRGFGSPDGFASGGKIGGSGGPTADDRLIAVSSNEWVIRARAAAYYGDAFMDRLNKMQLPKFATGGPVSSAPAPRGGAGAGLLNVEHMTVMAQDWRDFARQGQRLEQRAGIGGFGR